MINRVIYFIEHSKWSISILSQLHTLTLMLKIVLKVLNLKLAIMLEYENIKAFLWKATAEVGQ